MSLYRFFFFFCSSSNSRETESTEGYSCKPNKIKKQILKVIIQWRGQWQGFVFIRIELKQWNQLKCTRMTWIWGRKEMNKEEISIDVVRLWGRGVSWVPVSTGVGRNRAGPGHRRRPTRHRWRLALSIVALWAMLTIRSTPSSSAPCAGVRKPPTRRDGRRAPPASGPGRNPPVGSRIRCCVRLLPGTLSPFQIHGIDEINMQHNQCTHG